MAEQAQAAVESQLRQQVAKVAQLERKLTEQVREAAADARVVFAVLDVEGVREPVVELELLSLSMPLSSASACSASACS